MEKLRMAIYGVMCTVIVDGRTVLWVDADGRDDGWNGHHAMEMVDRATRLLAKETRHGDD